MRLTSLTDHRIFPTHIKAYIGVCFVAVNVHPDHDKIPVFRRENLAAFPCRVIQRGRWDGGEIFIFVCYPKSAGDISTYLRGDDSTTCMETRIGRGFQK